MEDTGIWEVRLVNRIPSLEVQRALRASVEVAITVVMLAVEVVMVLMDPVERKLGWVSTRLFAWFSKSFLNYL